jgi:hypothetical protein
VGGRNCILDAATPATISLIAVDGFGDLKLDRAHDAQLAVRGLLGRASIKAVTARASRNA